MQAESSKLVLFSEVIGDKTFENLTEKRAYLIGAFCNAIIGSSWNSKVSPKNVTFKKWLSNQPLIERNLLKIFDKASWFMGRIKLDSQRNRDLSHLVTQTHSESGEQRRLANYEVSFHFIRGYNDYAEFKHNHPGEPMDAPEETVDINEGEENE